MRRFSDAQQPASEDDAQSQRSFQRDSPEASERESGQGYSEHDEADAKVHRERSRTSQDGPTPIIINNRIYNGQSSEDDEADIRARHVRSRRLHGGPTPIVINNRHYNEQSSKDDEAELRVRDERIRPTQDRPAPIIINSRIPYDYSSDDEEYERRYRRRHRRRSLSSSRSRPVHSHPRSFSGMRSYSSPSVFEADNFPVTFQQVEDTGLSINVALNSNRSASRPLRQSKEFPLAPEVSAWQLRKTCLSDGQTSTQLHIVHSTEFSFNETGLGKTTLVCPPGLQKRESEAAVQMRWLHVQQTTKKLKTLEDLVLSCPYIDEVLLPVAVEAMEKVKESFSSDSDNGAFLEHGSILRLVGKCSQSPPDRSDTTETDSVLFFASPFLSLQPMRSPRASPGEYMPRTLLQTLYGYDVGGDREGRQVVQKLGASKLKKHVLHVSQLWCLLIGSNILITLSEKSAEEIQGKTIITDPRTSGNREPLLIRLTDAKHRQYPVVVERDYNFAEFLKYAVSMIGCGAADASNFDLFDEDHKPLTPSRWIQMMGASDTKLHNLWVIDRMTYFHFPLSAHSRSRSRSRRASRYVRSDRDRRHPSRSRLLGPERTRRLSDGAQAYEPVFVRSGWSPESFDDVNSSTEDVNTVRNSGARRQDQDESLSSAREPLSMEPSSTEELGRAEAPNPSVKGPASGFDSRSHQTQLMLYSGQLDTVLESTADDQSVPPGESSSPSLRINEPWRRLEEDKIKPIHTATRNVHFRYVDPGTRRSLMAAENSDSDQRPESGRNYANTAGNMDCDGANDTAQSSSEVSSHTEGVQAQDFAPISRDSENIGATAPTEPNDLQLSRISNRDRREPRRRGSESRSRAGHIIRSTSVARSHDVERGRRVYIHRPGYSTRYAGGTEHAYSTRYVDGSGYRDAAKYVRTGTRSTTTEKQKPGLIRNDTSTRPSLPRVYRLGDDENEDNSESELSDSSDVVIGVRSTNERVLPERIPTSGDTDSKVVVTTRWEDPKNVTSTVNIARGYSMYEHAQMLILRRLAHPEPHVQVQGCAVHETKEKLGRDIDESTFEMNKRVFHLPAKRDQDTGHFYDEFVIDLGPNSDKDFEEQVHLHWPPLPEDEPDAIQIDLPPFLTWRLNTEKDERTPEQVEKALISILNRLNRSLSTGVVARMYCRLYKCTMTDLIRRHEFLVEAPVLQTSSKQSSVSPNDAPGQSNLATEHHGDSNNVHNSGLPPNPAAQTQSAGDGLPSQSEKRHSSSNAPSANMNERPTASDTTASTPESRDDGSMKGPGSIKAINHHHVVLKALFEVSKAIFNAYVPSQGSHLIHHISARFWGAIDDICRQVLWEFNESSAASGGKYFTRDFDATSLLTVVGNKRTSSHQTWSTCALCKDDQGFTSASQALDHLHDSHFECAGKTERPYDDPCYVWLQHVPGDGPSYQQLPNTGNMGDVETFVSQLLPIRQKIEELHSLVANAQNNTLDARPPLPSNLVHAFEQILSLYSILAQELSLSNRRAGASHNQAGISDKIEELIGEEINSKALIDDHLHGAKKDIILLKGTSRHVDSAGVEAVGAEFLAMSLMVNMQNRSALTGQALASSSKADFIQLYERYSSRLRFQANRRPTKRVFLDIHALEEELDALNATVKAQDSVLDKYLQLLAPGSTRTTNATRVGLFKTENEYAQAQQRWLRARQRDIRVLREKSGKLKEQVKTTLEILEEDHGKAIRVFTFVTLLFLPLSFVTSFMGMNTKDLRDMEFTQNIFWMTGLPLTVVVITLALIYAYRGEALEDWFSDLMEMRSRRRSRTNVDLHGWTEADENDGIRAAPTGWKEKDGMIHIDSALVQTGQMVGRSEQNRKAAADMGGWLKDAKHRFRRRRGKGTHSGVRRRGTAGSTGL